jgi:CHAT domain-containing protein
VWTLTLAVAALCNSEADRTTVGWDHGCLNGEARPDWNRSSIETAISTLESVSDQAEKAGDLTRSAACLRAASELLVILSDPNRAEKYLIESRRLSHLADSADHEALACSLLSRLANQAGQTERSRSLYEEAVSISASSTSPWVRANAYFSAAEFNFYFGKMDATIDHYKQALNLAEEAGATDLRAQTLLNLGFSYVRQGDPLAALEMAEDSLAIWASNGNTRGQALALFGVGFMHSLSGLKQEGIDYYERSAAMFPNDLDLIEKAKPLNGLATISEDLGDSVRALSLREQAYELYSRADYPYGQLTTLPSLARLKHEAGKRTDANQLLDTAQVLAERLGSTFHVGRVSEDRGDLALETGDAGTAFSHYVKARNVYAQIGLAFPRIETRLGLALEQQGKLEQALDHFRSAYEENFRIKDLRAAAENKYHVSRITLQLGNAEGSIEAVRESISLSEQLVSGIGNRRLRSRFFSGLHERYGHYIRLLMDRYRSHGTEDDLFEAFQTSERSRSRRIFESISSARWSIGERNDLRRADSDLRISINAKSDLLVSMFSNNSDRAAVEKVESELNDLQHKLEDSVGRLKSADPLYAAVTEHAIGAGPDIRSTGLAENDALIEFYLGDTASYAWVIRDGLLSAVLLPSRSIIEAKVLEVNSLLQSRKPATDESIEAYQSRIRQTESGYTLAARELSNMILGPMAEKIKGKRLIVVPDGKLNYFPISALPSPGSESDDPLLLTNEVIYQPSAQTYALLKEIGQERKNELAKDLLVFSDPVFNPADERMTGIDVAQSSTQPYRFRLVESFSSLSRLPASKTEAETVTRAVGRSDLFMGFDATRDRLLSTNLSDYKVVHLATHGFLDPERPELSSLIFSRYDQTGNPIDESIRMHDIYSMKLNADLVVLSACQTGTGKEIKGEGVMGLNTAFLQSGARSVVSTLWQVEDNAANELMKEFYAKMVGEGMSPSAALRAAQIKLYNDPQFRSPFFWAAFTVHGDAATATPFKSDNSRLMMGIASLAILSLAAIFFFRWRHRTSKV